MPWNDLARRRQALVTVPGPSTLLTNLVSFWKLEEVSGTRYDVLQKNNLSVSGSPTLSDGKIGKSPNLVRASGNQFSISDASSTGLDPSGDMSLSFWVKRSSTTKQTWGLVAKGNVLGTTDSATVGWGAYINGSDQLAFAAYVNGANRTAQSSATVLNGVWRHVVCTFTNGGAGASTLQVYIDGSASGSANTAGTGPIVKATLPQSFRIGAHSSATNVAANQFSGQIDAVGIWSKVLSATEISNLYNSGNGRQYPFW